MIICNTCGTQNNDGSSFCVKCGSSLSAAPQNAAVQGNSAYNNAYAQTAAYTQANGAANVQYAPAATVKGCFGSAWEDVRTSQGWVGKSFLLGLIYLIPILNFVVAGYAMRWGRKAVFGNREGLPKQIFDDNSFATGFYYCVLSLLFGFVVTIACLVLCFVPLVGWLAAVVFFFFAYMFLSACGIRVALSGRLGSGFDFSAVWPAYKRGLGSLFSASVLPSLVIGLIVSAIESIVATIAFTALGVSLWPLLFNSHTYASSHVLLAAIAPSITALVVLGFVLLYFALVSFAVIELVTWRAMGYWAARNAGEWLMDPSMATAFNTVPANGYAYPPQGAYAPPAYAAAPVPAGAAVMPGHMGGNAANVVAGQYGTNQQSANQYGANPQGAYQQGAVSSNTPSSGAGGMAAPSTPVQSVAGTPSVSPVVSASSGDRETTVLGQNEGDRETTVLGGGCSFVKLVRSNGTALTVSDFPATIGKGSAASVQLSGNSAVSRVHARIIKNNNSFAIEDLDSTNGTRINGAKLTGNEVVALHDGDVLTFGDEDFTVRL